MLEFIRLEYIKVCPFPLVCEGKVCDVVDVFISQEIGFSHMRILNGINTLCQLTGLIARLVRISEEAKK